MTPLIAAVSKGQVDLVRVLLDWRADLAARDMSNATALHWAAFRGHVEVVSLLLSRGADPQARDRYGNTPADIANQAGFFATAELLRNAPGR